MAGSFNTYSDISGYVNTIWQDALLVARDNNLMAGLITTFGDRTGAAVRDLSGYGTATMVAVGETDDLAGQAFTPSSLATLTPAEIGAQFFLGDLRVESDPFGVQADASLELGQATGQKIEVDILSNFSSLTGGTVGTSGSVMTWGYFFAMLSRLRQQNAPLPYKYVCHPYQWHELGKAVGPGATVTNNPELQNEVVRNFYVGSVSGVDIYTTANATMSTNDAYAAMFSPMALALDVRRAPRLEFERDASRRGYELNMTSVYAHGVWRPKFGIQGIFKATAPTI